MLERAVSILDDLIAFPTVSTAPNLEIIAYLADRLTAMGARCRVMPDASGTKANLFATLGPDIPGGVMLSGHTDVVPVQDQDWSGDPFIMTSRDGRLYGRGSCDMKGFVAATLALATEIQPDDLRQPLHFAFTHDEETGCLGAQNLVAVLEEEEHLPDIAIVGEPTEMRIIEGHKGCCEYTTRFTGLEGHGSLPEAGVNAAEYAARYIGRLLELREELKARAPAQSPFSPPWTTINVGRVAGGVAHNVIVGKAELDWEMRPVQPSDADFVRRELARYRDNKLLPAMRRIRPDADIVTETIGDVVGLMPMPENQARALVAELTGNNSSGVVSFGTEAGLFQRLGMHVVVCGPGSIEQAHKPDEYLSLEQLELCCRMLKRLGKRLTG